MAEKSDNPIPYKPGMTLLPGQSVIIPIPFPFSLQPGMSFTMKDISAETYGKYQHCTLAKDGMFYADEDFIGWGRVKKNALPAPHQDTPELTAKAQAMHEKAAAKTTSDALGMKVKPALTLVGKVKRLLGL